MKKQTIVALSLFVALTLNACGGTAGSSDTTVVPDTTSAAP
ncbi:MAG: hypothetical protein RJA47_1994, partial [Actinomycetota bacterium]